MENLKFVWSIFKKEAKNEEEKKLVEILEEKYEKFEKEKEEIKRRWEVARKGKRYKLL